jgi:hypothetical protein
MWQKISHMIIEISSWPCIEKNDVDSVITALARFKYLSWDSRFNQNLDLNLIRDFWLSGRNQQKTYSWQKILVVKK